MKRLAVIVGYGCPQTGATWNVVWRILRELQKDFEITVFSQRTVNHALGKSFDYEGVRILEASDWWNDVRLACEGNRILKVLWRPVYYFAGFFKRTAVYVYTVRNTIKLFEREHSRHHFEAIFSVAGPTTSGHRAARLIKMQHKDIPWAAYSVDTLHNAAHFHDRLHPIKSILRRLYWAGMEADEMRSCSSADAFFCSPDIYAANADVHRGFPNRVCELPYPMVLPESYGQKSSRDRLRVVYGGMFYADIRNPTWFVGVLDRLLADDSSKFAFEFYIGLDGAFAKLFQDLHKKYGDAVQVFEKRPPDEFSVIMRDADVLLNFSNDLAQCSPSKLFDFIATGAPLLDVRYPNRAINPALKGHPMCLSVVNGSDPEASAKEVGTFLMEHAGQRVPLDELRERYATYLPDYCLRELKDVLNGR